MDELAMWTGYAVMVGVTLVALVVGAAFGFDAIYSRTQDWKELWKWRKAKWVEERSAKRAG